MGSTSVLIGLKLANRWNLALCFLQCFHPFWV